MGCSGSSVEEKDANFITTHELAVGLFDGATKEEYKVKEKVTIRVFDSSFGGKAAKDKFLESAIPTACFLDIGSDIADKTGKFPNTFPTPEIVKTTMENFGLSLSDKIVFYTQKEKLAGAARAFFVLTSFGFKNVFILDGGFHKWSTEGLPSEPGKEYTGPKSKGAALKYPTKLIAVYEEMKQFAEGALTDIQVVDFRPQKAFDGNADDNIAGCRQGNIPGSVNLPATDLVSPDSQLFIGDEAVNKLVTKLKLDPNKRTVTLCRTGVFGSLGFLVLKRQQFKHLQLYDGSWSEFGSL